MTHQPAVQSELRDRAWRQKCTTMKLIAPIHVVQSRHEHEHESGTSQLTTMRYVVQRRRLADITPESPLLAAEVDWTSLQHCSDDAVSSARALMAPDVGMRPSCQEALAAAWWWPHGPSLLGGGRVGRAVADSEVSLTCSDPFLASTHDGLHACMHVCVSTFSCTRYVLLYVVAAVATSAGAISVPELVSMACSATFVVSWGVYLIHVSASSQLEKAITSSQGDAGRFPNECSVVNMLAGISYRLLDAGSRRSGPLRSMYHHRDVICAGDARSILGNGRRGCCAWGGSWLDGISFQNQEN